MALTKQVKDMDERLNAEFDYCQRNFWTLENNIDKFVTDVLSKPISVLDQNGEVHDWLDHRYGN